MIPLAIFDFQDAPFDADADAPPDARFAVVAQRGVRSVFNFNTHRSKLERIFLNFVRLCMFRQRAVRVMPPRVRRRPVDDFSLIRPSQAEILHTRA